MTINGGGATGKGGKQREEDIPRPPTMRTAGFLSAMVERKVQLLPAVIRKEREREREVKEGRGRRRERETERRREGED